MSEKKQVKKVEPWVDIVELEHEVLDFWKENKTFDKLREKNAEGEPWSFLDGPITANNPMGVHHAWGRTLKDAFQRYYAMNGRQLRYQNGFDCQGLWVEIEVEKEHGFKSKREVIDYGVDKFVADCKARVRKYSGVQTEQSVRLGMWMDWENSYFTMAEENNYTIWSFLKKCHERGKIYRGSDVMPWSGRSGTAYSQMEVIEGRKLVAHTSLFVRFPLLDREGENLLVWTTTPWTLTSNVAAAVNVDLDYVKLRAHHDNEIYYFAADNLNFKRLEKQYLEKRWVDGVPKLKTIAQIFNERGGFTVEGKVKGSELVGLRYRGPFDELDGQNIPGGFPFNDAEVKDTAREAHRVIDGGRDKIGNPIVVAGEGTGIVHTAPGCGDIDHEIGEKLGLPKIAPLDEAACFLPEFGFLAGRKATDKETVKLILDSLREKEALVATEQYPHIYPHCWRSGDELVFRMVDEWYINMDWRDEIKKVVEDIRWIPEYGHDRELEWLTNMRDWMISKKRFWGLALPIWVCEQCESFEVIGSREELKERAVEGWDIFEGHSPHRPFIDAVKLKCPKCGGLAHRVEDVGNPWLDAGIVPYSTTKYNTDKEYWKTWMPADLVLECFPGQFRNWFYSLLSMSTMMEGIAPFKTLVGHALVRDEHGQEMHKSTGNAIWFDDAAEQAGADIMRWLYVQQNPQVNLNFGFGPLKEVRGRFINTLWNTYAFLANYARLADWRPAKTPTPFAQRPDFDRWILTELQGCIATVRERIEDFDLRSAALAIEAFVESLSNWYIRHNRRRFWKVDGDSAADSVSAFETLYKCVHSVLRLSAPMIPFITEKMYQNLVRGLEPEAPESVHLCAFPNAKADHIDEVLTEEMRAIVRITNLALSARDAEKLKVRQPLAKLTVGPATEQEAAAVRRFETMLAEDLNVKAIELKPTGTESPLAYTVKPNFKTLGPKLGKKVKVLAQFLGKDASSVLNALRQNAEVIPLELEGQSFELSPEDFIMQAIGAKDLAVSEDAGLWVALDTQLSPELKREGLMRDLLRRMQTLRKDQGLEIEDRVSIRWASTSTEVVEAIEHYASFIAEELLATRFEKADSDAANEIKVGKVKLMVELKKN